MTKSIITAVTVLSLLLVAGCSDFADLTQGLTEESPPPGFEIIREAQIAPEWEMNQIRIVLGAGDEFSTLLQLADGDSVDGYFYLEQSDNVSFEIRGTSLIYQSGAGTNQGEDGISSSRFSFTANQPQGTTYTLTFRNPTTKSEPTVVVVFMEIIFPATGAMFFPVEAWKS